MIELKLVRAHLLYVCNILFHKVCTTSHTVNTIQFEQEITG